MKTVAKKHSRPGPTLALAALALVVAAVALYWSGLRHPPIFDDYHLNAYAFRTYYADALARFGQVRWFSDATFGAVHAIGGPGLFWHRLGNVLLHGAAAALLFWVLARLFFVVLEDERARWLAFFGALWFALNPAAVYGVAYLMQRSIVLATLFSLAALGCFLEARRQSSLRWYVASIVAYFLAVSSKEHAVMLPAVALALAMLVRGSTRELFWCLGAFAIVGAAVLAQRPAVIGTAYEPFAADYLAGPASPAAVEGLYALSIENQATLFFRYLGTWLVPWPGWMSIDLRVTFPSSLLAWPETLGFFAWLGYAAGALWLLTRRGRIGLAGFGLLYPWLFALTEMSTVRLQEPFVLYRSYLWMSGLPAILPALVARPLPRWSHGLLGALLVAFAAGAYDRIGSMASAYGLWNDAVRKNTDPRAPGVERAYVNRGIAELDARRYEPAHADFERALELNPRWPDAHLARGTYLLRTGRLPEALAAFERAMALDPGYAAAYNKRCVARASLERMAEALADCDRAVELGPLDDEAWINRGVVQRALGRLEQAAASYQRALEIRPTNGSAHYNYGVLLLDQGRQDSVVKEHFAKACRSRVADACAILGKL